MAEDTGRFEINLQDGDRLDFNADELQEFWQKELDFWKWVNDYRSLGGQIDSRWRKFENEINSIVEGVGQMKSANADQVAATTCRTTPNPPAAPTPSWSRRSVQCQKAKLSRKRSRKGSRVFQGSEFG